MTISKKQLQEAVEEARKNSFRHGQIEGRAVALSEFNNSKAHAQVQILAAAAELAQANAKLTYAMSRMVAEKGW